MVQSVIRLHCTTCKKSWSHFPGKVYRLIVRGHLIAYRVPVSKRYALCPECKRDHDVRNMDARGFVGDALVYRQRVKRKG